MLAKLRNRQGFTLIELLIVVAIIGILAAVAIPQLSAYRMRGFNSAALSDLKNAKTAQESLFSDFQTYGKTQGTAGAMALLGAATVGTGPGAVSIGPVPAASGVVPGALISGPPQDVAAANGVGYGVGISNQVALVANSMAAPAPAVDPGSPSYIMISKHMKGNRAFASEAENTAVFFVQNDLAAFVGIAISAAAGTPSSIPAPTTAQDLTTAVNGNGSPNTNWAPL